MPGCGAPGRRSWRPIVGLAELYLSDPRFREHYDGVHPGSTEWLAKAMRSWAER
ncbi:MAG: TipAS antibiotic-recognition domain-containing protein [Planctomycetota bacterium]